MVAVAVAVVVALLTFSPDEEDESYAKKNADVVVDVNFQPFRVLRASYWQY